MQHGLSCLEAREDCRVCRERATKFPGWLPRLAALSSQNMVFGIGLVITVCLLASILNWRGEREPRQRGKWFI
jgi:hypothetical protein